MIHKHTPKILGILNITEDSFSDGGKYLSADAALNKAKDLISQGAHIIDIGPASSNPASGAVPADIQIKRSEAVFAYLKKENIPVSLDVCDPVVQSWAIEQNADYINDIDGFKHPEILEKLKDKNTKLIVMHKLQDSGKADKRTGDPETIIENIKRFFLFKIEFFHKYNIEPQRIILDPGMGFFLGSDPLNSVKTLNSIKELKKEFPFPFLISVSRKSFLGEMTGSSVSQREFSTLAAELYSIFVQDADMIRTHNPAALRDSIIIWNTLLGSK
jgi:dihydropteroate synthase